MAHLKRLQARSLLSVKTGAAATGLIACVSMTACNLGPIMHDPRDSGALSDQGSKPVDQNPADQSRLGD